MLVIYQNGQYRITESEECEWSMEELKGDCFKPANNQHMHPISLAQAEKLFEREVEDGGVYMYELQIWNSEVDGGWEHVDSCGGFVGNYEDERHYIVDEFKTYIDKLIIMGVNK